MQKLKFEILIITSPENFPKETELINFFLDNGAGAIYFRKENYSNEFIQHFFEKIKQEHHQKIMLPFPAVNNLIYEKYKPIFHFKENDRITENLENINADTILSTSIHDLSELENVSTRFKYVFYSPIFESISKPNYKPKLPFEEITEKIKRQRAKGKRQRLIALGGVSEKNILDVKKAGFDGAALLGAIWKSENPKGFFLNIHYNISKTLIFKP